MMNIIIRNPWCCGRNFCLF